MTVGARARETCVIGLCALASLALVQAGAALSLPLDLKEVPVLKDMPADRAERQANRRRGQAAAAWHAGPRASR